MTLIPDFPQQRIALATGVRLDVVDIGPRDGKPLIFLHGFPESHRTWRHQLAHLSDRYRCIAPDQRGYCRSDKPEGVENYSADKLTADIFALATALGIERFTIVGHDWGGAIAWSVALNGMTNGRVERAIIANAPHPFVFQRKLIEDPDQRAASQYMRAFRDPANDELIASEGITGLLRKTVNWERSEAMEPAERDRLLADWKVPGAAQAMVNWYRATPVYVPAMDEEVALPAFLSAPFPVLTVPTLVIWAMDDLALPACNLDGLDALIDDLTVEQVHGCGHFVPWEAPDAVNAAMDRWLAARPFAAMSEPLIDPVVADKAAEAPVGKERLFRRREEGQEESPVTTIELFFDLVFVFAVTQLSHRLLSHMSPVGALETLILFLATWWAWVYTSWATNWLDPERGKVRLMLMAVMLAGITMAVSIPDAFGKDGWLFVAAYLSIQIGRTAYLAWAFHGVRASGARNFVRITAYFLLSAPLWIAGALLDHDARLAAWAAALAIEYAGPFLFFRFPGLGRSQGSDWDISGGHMAERCALFIIIALGESILVIGQTFVGLPRSGLTSAALLSSFVSSAAMWWIYFDIGARRATELMEHNDQAGLLARNGYTFLHIPIVAGIIVTAVGDELLLAHPLDSAEPAFLLTAVGGPWLFVTATMCFKWYTWARSFPPLSHGVGATLLFALGVWAAIDHLPSLVVGGLATACLIATASWEWFSLHGGWQRWWPGRPAG